MFSSVPKYRKAVMCLTEKMHLLANLHSGMSYSAFGHEFNINESTFILKSVLNRNLHGNKVNILIS